MLVFLRLLLFLVASQLYAEPIDVVFIGDSQFTDNGGGEGGQERGLIDILENYNSRCSEHIEATSINKNHFTFSGIGMSGSNLLDWLTRDDKKKNTYNSACGISPRYPYGTLADSHPKTDLMLGKPYPPLCQEGQSALDTLLVLQPKIVVANFLGRYVGSSEATIRNHIRHFERALPSGTSCVFMTSLPTLDFDALPPMEKGYRLRDMSEKQKKLWENRNTSRQSRRSKAELIENILKETGRCEVIQGMTSKTETLIAQNPKYYPTFKQGLSVSPEIWHDRMHPNHVASAKFFEIYRKEICIALAKSHQRSQAYQNPHPTSTPTRPVSE